MDDTALHIAARKGELEDIGVLVAPGLTSVFEVIGKYAVALHCYERTSGCRMEASRARRIDWKLIWRPSLQCDRSGTQTITLRFHSERCPRVTRSTGDRPMLGVPT
jgi:hypothetical protein